MRFQAAIALLSLGSVVSAVPASAQYTGSRIGRDADKHDGLVAIKVIADCLVGRQPKIADEWLKTMPGSLEERKVIGGITPDLGMCMASHNKLVLANKTVKFQPRALRHPVANLMVARALSRAGNRSIDVVSQPWFAERLRLRAANDPLDRDALAIQDFGHCVAQKGWAATKAFLLTEPGSSAERSALQPLVSFLGPCLTDDVTLKLTPQNLRVVLDEPVYHLLNPSVVPATAAKSR